VGRDTGGQRERDGGEGRRERSSINIQMTAKEYRSIQGLAKIL